MRGGILARKLLGKIEELLAPGDTFSLELGRQYIKVLIFFDGNQQQRRL